MSQLKNRLSRLEQSAPQEPQIFVLVDGEKPPADARPDAVIFNVTREQYERLEEIKAEMFGKDGGDHE